MLTAQELVARIQEIRPDLIQGPDYTILIVLCLVTLVCGMEHVETLVNLAWRRASSRFGQRIGATAQATN